MKSETRHNRIRIRAAATLLAIILLCVVYLSMISYIYINAENEGYESLRTQTEQIKSDIRLQIVSDTENLVTMASFASKLYSDGGGYELLFDSFTSIGLIARIELLLPDGTLLTKNGEYHLGGEVSFEKEKREQLSGRVRDFVNDTDVVRSAVPVMLNGKTVAVLYGVIELDVLERRFGSTAERDSAVLYVLERGTGDFIIDTQHETLMNAFTLGPADHRYGYTDETMEQDIISGKTGYSAYESAETGEMYFIYYMPAGVGDWQIMLAEPERIVFAEADLARNNLFILFIVIVLIMTAYLMFIFATEHDRSALNYRSTNIRRLLLEVNRRFDSLKRAFQTIAEYARSRSVFFVDNDGIDYNYIVPSFASELLCDDDRRYFIDELMAYVSDHFSSGADVDVFTLRADMWLAKQNHRLFGFIKAHGIKCVCFAAVADEERRISVLGVINPRRASSTENLLRDIAVCVAMAVHGQRHLRHTESMAVTDSLTGLGNRMAYKKAVSELEGKMPERLVCVYIDVNELHYFNNKYGHTAGDEMLCYIADVLATHFHDSRLFRMGGDEFLILTEDISEKAVKSRIAGATALILEKGYNISAGISVRTEDMSIEALMMIAEKRMYEEKAAYYQAKEIDKYTSVTDRKIEFISTGIPEVDACLAIMGTRFLGVYSVSLKTDKVLTILAPKYFAPVFKQASTFSEAAEKYIRDFAAPEYHRILMNFLQYDVLASQLENGRNPKVTFNRVDGDRVSLSVYAVPSDDGEITDTIWIIEKENIRE